MTFRHSADLAELNSIGMQKLEEHPPCWPYWGVAYRINSSNPRAQRRYYIARLIQVDGKWWELYRYDSHSGSNNHKRTREAGLQAGLGLLHGVFRPLARLPHGSAMVWSLDKRKSHEEAAIGRTIGRARDKIVA